MQDADVAAPGRVAGVVDRGARLGARLTAYLVAHAGTALAGLVLVHWAAVAAFALTVRHNGWAYYQGGDQIWLSTTGWLLAHGDLAPTYVGYGWALVLAPIMLVTGPGYLAAMPLVAAANVLVLAPLAIWAVYGLASLVAGRLFGLLAAAAWTAAPFASIPLWRQDYHERFVEQFLPQALGLTALADYPSMVLLVVAAYLFARALETDAATDAALAGLVVGFAVGTKPSNAIFLAAPTLAALVAVRARLLVPFGLALAPTLAALALWKLRGLGAVPAFALEQAHLAAATVAAVPQVERYVDLDWDVLRSNLVHLREYFWSARLLQWLPIAGVLGLARGSRPLAVLCATWLAAFVAVKGTTAISTVESGSFFRLLMPSLPAFLLLAAGTVLLVPGAARRLSARAPRRRARPATVRAVAVAAVALAAVPLAAAAVAQPLDRPPAAITVSGILVPETTSLEVDVKADGPARVLTWKHGDVGRAGVFYRVYRTAAGGVDVSCADHDGAAECALQMLLLGTTREPSWRDGSPPPGAQYRVGVATNWLDDEQGGDVFLISPPVSSGS